MVPGLKTEQDGVSVTFTYDDARGRHRLVVTPRRLALDDRTLPWGLVREIVCIDSASGDATVVLDTEEGPVQIAAGVPIDVARPLQDALVDARARSRSRSPMSARRVLSSVSHARPPADDGWHAPADSAASRRNVLAALAGAARAEGGSSALSVSADVDAEVFEVMSRRPPVRRAQGVMIAVLGYTLLLGGLTGIGVVWSLSSHLPDALVATGIVAAFIAASLLFVFSVLVLLRWRHTVSEAHPRRLVARRAGLDVGGRQLPWEEIRALDVVPDDLTAHVVSGRVEALLDGGERFRLTGPMRPDEATWLCARLLTLRGEALDGEAVDDEVATEDLRALQALRDGPG